MHLAIDHPRRLLGRQARRQLPKRPHKLKLFLAHASLKFWLPGCRWSCQLCHQPAPRPPLAVLVSNPTPPGQINPARTAPQISGNHTRDQKTSRLDVITFVATLLAWCLN
jgi:hypothetical protein